MELIHGLHNLRPRHHGCVVTIGKFDGVHLGHRALLARTRALAERHAVPATVLTFDPTPYEYFRCGAPQPRVNTLRDNLRALGDAGMQRLLRVRFGAAIANMSPLDFIDALLVRRLGARAVVVGDDFRFGRDRAGDPQTLSEHGQRCGFEVAACDSVLVAGERVSSSAIRAALALPDLQHAERLLGGPYRISGTVRPGLRLGRKLGMPTANIALPRPMALRQGVYAVQARVGARCFDGVANLGVRPTLGLRTCLLETHVFEDPGSLYGELLDVEFRAFLRPEQTFATLDALSAQMQADARDARALLTKPTEKA